MDYYKELGLNQSATKNEIKEAYRKLAVKYHPDKHTQSSKPIRDGATLRFRQISEAYEVLVDDRKRADYNLRCRSGGGAGASSSNSSSSGRGGGGGGGYSYNDEYGYDNNNKRPKYRSTTSSSGTRQGNKWGFIFEFITTRRILLNLAFVSVVLGGSALIESSEEALWKKYNPGRLMKKKEKGKLSYFNLTDYFEPMESIEKTKRQKEKTKRQKEKM